MDGRVCVNVPYGFWREGRLCREVWLRAIQSRDETFVLESAGMSSAARANQLLARCLAMEDLSFAARRKFVRGLVAGDREVLLLHLRRISFGDKFDGIFPCTQPRCDATLELDLSATDLLLPPYGEVAETYTREIPEGDLCYEVSFRMPTAGDQEEVAELARLDAERAARIIFDRCVSSVKVQGREVESSQQPPSLLDKVSTIMEGLDPQAVIEFELKCPACENAYSAQLDMANFILQELDQRADRLLRDIHTLAVWYHWSEGAILALPHERRERYLDLIASDSGGV